MSNMHLVTGRAGEKHVSAADEGALNAAVFGSGQYVLNEGGKMAATVVSNNAVRIADGAAMFHGRYIRLEGYEDLTIASGTQGTYRNDLIVIRYTKDTTTNTESTKLVVIKGTPNSATASDPAYVSGNILEGAVQADMPLYRIPLDNVNIGTPVALFEMMEANVGNLDSKQDDTNSLAATTALADADYFPFYDASVSGNRKIKWSNIVAKIKSAIWGTASGFVKVDGSGGVSGVSTIPIANGGTGATTAAKARTALGLGSVATKDTVPVANGGTGATTAEAARAALGLGAVATKNTVPIANGGTGATTAEAARTNLGLGSVATKDTVPIANGGTGSTTRRGAYMGLVYLGTNPVTLDNDTTAFWVDMGAGYCYISAANSVNGQPTSYGFIENYICGQLVSQTWFQLSGSGRTFHRSGDANGWYGDGWVEDYNSYNLKPATLDGNSRVVAKQTQSFMKEISGTTYTLVAEDAGKFLRAGQCTITVPYDSSYSIFPIGTEIEINANLTNTTIKIVSADTTNLKFQTTNGIVTSVETDGNFAVVVLKRTASNRWLVKGEIA